MVKDIIVSLLILKGLIKMFTIFESLELGFEQIKNSLLGVAGVYKLINKEDSTRFYIGSSVNISRRISEYVNLTRGTRSPKSNSELEISRISASGWI
jgi:hypothetical protein